MRNVIPQIVYAGERINVLAMVRCMPNDILGSTALVSQAAEINQVANRLFAATVSSLFSRLSARSRTTAVWFVGRDIEPQLAMMSIGAAGKPVYLCPGGLVGSPFGSLYGRPVLPIEYHPTLCQIKKATKDAIILDDSFSGSERLSTPGTKIRWANVPGEVWLVRDGILNGAVTLPSDIWHGKPAFYCKFCQAFEATCDAILVGRLPRSVKKEVPQKAYCLLAVEKFLRYEVMDVPTWEQSLELMYIKAGKRLLANLKTLVKDAKRGQTEKAQRQTKKSSVSPKGHSKRERLRVPNECVDV